MWIMTNNSYLSIVSKDCGFMCGTHLRWSPKGVAIASITLIQGLVNLEIGSLPRPPKLPGSQNASAR